MPRKARIKSPFNVYHIMIRGINKQDIFYEARDYIKFIDTIFDVREKLDFDLLAYCLMSNHVHFLIMEKDVAIGDVLKRISGKYALWFNKKYARVGHLFQDRFRSEAIDSEQYFLSVLKYIHMNPVKGRICNRPDEYPYSSFHGYYNNALISSEFVNKIIDQSEFKRFHEQNAGDDGDDSQILDIDNQNKRIGDKAAYRILYDICRCKSAAEFQKLSHVSKEYAMAKLIECGMNSSQISRITGETRYRIGKYICK